MIQEIPIAYSHGFMLSFGVEADNSLVKHVTVDARQGVGYYADLTLYASDGQTAVFTHHFLNVGLVTTIQLPQTLLLAYATETVTVPATGEEVSIMSAPQYSFG